MTGKIGLIGTESNIIVMRAYREAKSKGIDVILIDPKKSNAELMAQYPDRNIIRLIDDSIQANPPTYSEPFKLINPIRDITIKSGQQNRRERRRNKRLNNRNKL